MNITANACNWSWWNDAKCCCHPTACHRHVSWLHQLRWWCPHLATPFSSGHQRSTIDRALHSSWRCWRWPCCVSTCWGTIVQRATARRNFLENGGGGDAIGAPPRFSSPISTVWSVSSSGRNREKLFLLAFWLHASACYWSITRLKTQAIMIFFVVRVVIMAPYRYTF